MQLSELISAVRDDVQDPGSARFTDAAITRHLNSGQLKIAMVSQKFNAWTTTIPAGTVSAALPADLLIPKTIKLEVGSGNRYEPKIQKGLPPESSQVMGSPTHVYINGNTAFYYPVPGQDMTQIISGIKRPTPMVNSTDTPDVDDADDILIAYASYMCFLSDGDPLVQLKQQIYERERQEWSILDALKYPLPTQIERDNY